MAITLFNMEALCHAALAAGAAAGACAGAVPLRRLVPCGAGAGNARMNARAGRSRSPEGVTR